MRFNPRRRDDTAKVLLTILAADRVTLVFNAKGLWFFLVGCIIAAGLYYLIWIVDGVEA